MDGMVLLSIIITVCLIIILMVIGFLFIEYTRFKRAEEEITYYLNKKLGKPTAPAPSK